jgi:hypothetical protein
MSFVVKPMKKRMNEIEKVRGATVWLWALPFVNALELRLGRQKKSSGRGQGNKVLAFS